MSRVSVTNQQKNYSLLSIIRDEISVHCTKEKINREVCLVFCGHSQHRIIYNLQFGESNFWFDIYSFISLLLFNKNNTWRPIIIKIII